MRRWLAIALLALMLVVPLGAGAVERPVRVVALSGSLADAWTLAGGQLVGVTEDADDAQKASAAIVGGTHAPSLEAIVALAPDLVLLSSVQREQVTLAQQLQGMGTETASYDVNHYEAYLAMMREFCDWTGDEAAYQAQVDAVQAPIEEILAGVDRDADDRPTALLLRAYGSGVKAKGSDNLAGAMLRDMGFFNPADLAGVLLEDITLERIIMIDPDYIFVTTMGADDGAALAMVDALFTQSPAWAALTAVQGGQYHVLPKALFQQKPNARWAEAYQYLAGLRSAG